MCEKHQTLSDGPVEHGWIWRRGQAGITDEHDVEARLPTQQYGDDPGIEIVIDSQASHPY